MRTIVRSLVFLSALCVVGLLAGGSAFAQGMLIPSDRGVDPLRLTSHEVEFSIRDNAAVTHVTQRFQNHTSRPLEAVYYFAVPAGATTTDFALWMNGERIEGDVLPRDEARRVYESIVQRMRDPGLLEYVDGTLFRASIFPVPPNGEQTVEIEYASLLETRNGASYYVLPLHTDTTSERPRFSVSGRVESSSQIARVYSPHYEVDEVVESSSARRIGAELPSGALEEDFELFITHADDDVGLSLITWERDAAGEAGYFMLSVAAGQDLRELEVIDKQVTFVIDTSGSMEGEKMRQAIESLEMGIDRLGENDTFNIIAFSTDVRTAFDEPRLANRAGREAGREFARRLVARGNTNISGALESALEQSSQDGRPHAVVFLTDGLPTSGERNVARILELVESGLSQQRTRVFSFGVGYDVNTRLLDGMARRGRGRSGYVRPNESIVEHLEPFLERIANPLLTEVELAFGAAEVFDVYPAPLPDLYRDEALTVFGRYRNPSSTLITLRGQAGRESYRREIGVEFGPADSALDLSFVANLWASRRVSALLRLIDEEGENEEWRQEVVALATEWNIVTPYTSYLAVDPSEQHMVQRPGRPMQGASSGVGRGSGSFAAEEAEPVAQDFGGGGLRRDRGQAANAAPRASRSAVGREAVEASISLGALEDSDRVADSGGSRRVVAGRTFELRGGIWRQSDASSSADERVEYLSDAYFALLRRHPELRDVLALGERVVFVLNGRTYEIYP